MAAFQVFLYGRFWVFTEVIVKFHVVFFAAMLLNLRHDLRFAIATDLPFAVLRANIRATEIHFLLAVLFLLSDSHSSSSRDVASDSIRAQYGDLLKKNVSSTTRIA